MPPGKEETTGTTSLWKRWLAHHFPAPFTLRPLTLRFRDPAQERAFSDSRGIDPLFLSRLTLSAGLLVFAAFGILDYLRYPDEHHRFWLIRFGIGAPAISFGLLLCFLPSARRIHDWILFGVAQCVGLSVVLMMIVGSSLSSDRFLSGFLLVLIFNFTAFRMRGFIAVLSGLLLVVMFALGGWLGGYGSQSFHIIGIVTLVIGMAVLTFGAGLSELFARRSFVQEQWLESLAHTDSLTGLPNRRDFMNRLQADAARCDRYRRSLSLALIDADHFKRINDEHGHAVGDEVLRELAARCAEQVRDSDLLARLGGEEFALLMPETDAEGARATCERIQQGLAERPIMVSTGAAIHLTLSIGVVSASGSTCEPDQLMRMADDAMYAAKEAGRDRVVVTKG